MCCILWNFSKILHFNVKNVVNLISDTDRLYKARFNTAVDKSQRYIAKWNRDRCRSRELSGILGQCFVSSCEICLYTRFFLFLSLSLCPYPGAEEKSSSPVHAFLACCECVQPSWMRHWKPAIEFELFSDENDHSRCQTRRRGPQPDKRKWRDYFCHAKLPFYPPLSLCSRPRIYQSLTYVIFNLCILFRTRKR